ncbi:transcriptional regulator TACO1-like protein [Chytriomyces sp. MP71]|nr:transcriptional regulator TACO1-like protein [Chytriomyces sp. MP71]
MFSFASLRSRLPTSLRPFSPFTLTQVRFAGHNRWSQIKRAKGANDVARAKTFSKLATQIISAVIAGKGETDTGLNLYLASAIAQARAVQMPKGNVETALKKGIAAAAGKSEAAGEPVVYEGMSAQGVAVVVTALTTNRNKTFAEVRFCFSKNEGALKPIMFQFEKRSRLVVGPKEGNPEKYTLNRLLDQLLELDGVEDIGEEVEEGDDVSVELLCSLSDLLSLQKQVLGIQGLEVKEMDLVAYVPTVKTDPLSEDQSAQFEKLLEDLENQADVVKTFHNATLPK